MRTGSYFAFSLLLAFSTGCLRAQKVLYSPYIGTQAETRFEVIGKAGNYYWVQKSKTKFRYKKAAEPWLDDKEVRFEIYDERMNPLKEVPSFISADFVKEYLVPGDDYFDQLTLRPGDQKILALLNRYTPDGNLSSREDTVAEFPARLKCGDFILVRSQDKGKILLLGFETIPESPPTLHAILYDKDWNLICRTEYTNRNISKPLVQYDLIEYPLEDYNSASIKLGNNGECLMVVSSGTNHNYILSRLNAAEGGFSYKEIKLPSNCSVEDAGIYFDNGKQEGFAGILSRVKTSAIKNIRVIHYTLGDFRIDRDTSYALNTLAGNKMKNENIYEEYFMTVPDKGFLFLKEYGRTFSSEGDGETNIEGEYANGREKSFNKPLPETFNKDEYTRYDNLAGIRSNFDRGDLTLYYFPAKCNDSCWSGIINKEQVTESGNFLSFLCFFAEKR